MKKSKKKRIIRKAQLAQVPIIKFWQGIAMDRWDEIQQVRTYWQNTDAERKARINELEVHYEDSQKRVEELEAENEGIKIRNAWQPEMIAERTKAIRDYEIQTEYLEKENAELKQQLAAAQDNTRIVEAGQC